uniref:receptor protein kinase TMK1-like n=1 Tax=Erigeron canadensis TaxID=72917 RepID=UPI001CB9CF98|nr:receptor protein kinase TMK1-like [Erigeron canadensis]
MTHVRQFDHLKIPLESIKSATNNFAQENFIGKGGFGKVYKGVIDHFRDQHTKVAVKRLERWCGQGDPEFWKEIMVLSLYRHENIVSLFGYCDAFNERILVYRYASKKSLDFYIDKEELSWVQRLHICIGAARGLAYLHAPTDTLLRVLHRDIKSSNILLDENWNAKIADFGLSKLAPVNKHFTYLISNAVGTFGYWDPVYAETGLLTKESDVYSFGVVLFEVLCGRLCIGKNNNDGQSFVQFVRQYYEENKISEIVFGKIKDQINHHSLNEYTKIAYQCLMRNREERPLMDDIVKALETALSSQCSDAGVGGEQTRIVGILNVKVLNGLELNLENPYVILKLKKWGDHLDSYCLPSMKKTTIWHGYKKRNSYWNEEFTLYVEDPDHQWLEIWVYNSSSIYNQVEIHEQVAVNSLQFSQLTHEIPHAQNVKLFSVKDGFFVGRYYRGEIKVETIYKPCTNYTIFEEVCPLQKAPTGTPQEGGLLVVIIHEADHLKPKHHSNPYVSLLFRGELRKSVPIKKTTKPKWQKEFTFMLEQPPTDEKLHLEVISTPWKKIIYRKEELMGYIDIKAVDAVKEKRIIKTYRLQHDVVSYGWLMVELQWRSFN